MISRPYTEGMSLLDAYNYHLSWLKKGEAAIPFWPEGHLKAHLIVELQNKRKHLEVLAETYGWPL